MIKSLSFGLFTVFIAFVLFTVIKNLFFNSNQLSKKIRYWYMSVTLPYLIIFILGVCTLVALSEDDRFQLIAINVSFFSVTLMIIFMSLRMESNDTSAHSKWKALITRDLTSRKKETWWEESWLMISFYIITLIGAGTGLSLMFTNLDEVIGIPKRCVIAFDVLAALITLAAIFISWFRFGKLIIMNLQYNMLWDGLINNSFKSKDKRDEACLIMKELFIELFEKWPYNNESSVKKNNDILVWLDKILEYDYNDEW